MLLKGGLQLQLINGLLFFPAVFFPSIQTLHYLLLREIETQIVSVGGNAKTVYYGINSQDETRESIVTINGDQRSSATTVTYFNANRFLKLFNEYKFIHRFKQIFTLDQSYIKEGELHFFKLDTTCEY